MDCVWCTDSEPTCAMCGRGLAPTLPGKSPAKPKPERAAKRKYFVEPPAPVRGADPEVDAIRALDAWGMLAPEEKVTHARVLRPQIPPQSAEVFKQWREEHTVDTRESTQNNG